MRWKLLWHVFIIVKWPLYPWIIRCRMACWLAIISYTKQLVKRWRQPRSFYVLASPSSSKPLGGISCYELGLHLWCWTCRFTLSSGEIRNNHQWGAGKGHAGHLPQYEPHSSPASGKNRGSVASSNVLCVGFQCTKISNKPTIRTHSRRRTRSLDVQRRNKTAHNIFFK